MLTTQKHNNPWSCVYICTLYATIMMSILLTKQDEIIHIHNIMMKFYNLHVHVKEYRPCWRWSCWLLLHINNTQCNIVSCWWTELTRMYRLYTSSNMTAFSTERELSDITIHTHTQSELALGKGKKDPCPGPHACETTCKKRSCVTWQFFVIFISSTAKFHYSSVLAVTWC